MIKISPHFTWDDVIVTQHRNIDNSIPTELRNNALLTAAKLEVVRMALYSSPITVNSWFRCLELNTAIGSKPTSDHTKATAIDFTASGFGSPIEICKKLVADKDTIGFKQLILEHSWVHISWDHSPGVVPKLEVLSLLKSGGYAVGLTDNQGRIL